MEKEILIQNLRDKLGADKSSAISDKSFDAFSELWKERFADDAAITEDTWKEPLAILSQYAGQKRHDDAAFATKYKADYDARAKAELERKIEEARKTAIEQYIKEHPGKEGEDGGEDGKTVEATINRLLSERIDALNAEDGALGKLSKLVSSFIEQSNKRDRETQLRNAQNVLTEYLKGRGASSQPAIEDALKDIVYEDNLDIEDLKKKVSAAYESRYKRYFGDGGKPFGGGNAGGEDGLDTETADAVKSHIERLKKEAEAQQGYQQSLTSNFQ